MNDTEVDEFLEHYGVRGMHWGITTKKKTQPHSHDSKKVRNLRKRPAHNLSNQELQTVNTRMKLEAQFNQHNPSAHEQGKRMAKEILGTAALLGGFYELSRTPMAKHLMSLGSKHATKQLKLF